LVPSRNDKRSLPGKGKLASEDYESVENLEELETKIQELVGEAALLSIDDITDDRFKLEDKKRKFAQMLHLLTSGRKPFQISEFAAT